MIRSPVTDSKKIHDARRQFRHCSSFFLRKHCYVRTVQSVRLEVRQRKVPTSSRLFTTKPWAFITGRTWAARARKSCLASSWSLPGRGVTKLTWGLGLGSFSLKRACTMVLVENNSRWQLAKTRRASRQFGFRPDYSTCPMFGGGPDACLDVRYPGYVCSRFVRGFGELAKSGTCVGRPYNKSILYSESQRVTTLHAFVTPP